MILGFHPLADLFPLMEGAELDSLVISIRENGQRDPIVLLDGAILDGRNRYRACIAAGIEPVVKPFDGGDPLKFVLNANLERHRRYLNEDQLAMIAVNIIKMSEEKQAKIAEQKERWIKKARSEFCAGPRQQCYICWQYNGLTEAHHIVPLALQFDAGVDDPIQDFEWLCPTHHSAAHRQIDALLANRMDSDLGMPLEEMDAMGEWGIKFAEIFTTLPRYDKVRNARKKSKS